MTLALNTVVLSGNLTRDVELRKTHSGQSVTDIGLAINDAENPEAEATFLDITCWGRLAENAAEYLCKGCGIIVEGELKQDKWESKEGERRVRLKVIARRLHYVDTKNSLAKRKASKE